MSQAGWRQRLEKPPKMKRLLIVAIAVIGVLAAIAAAAPLIISTDIVKRQIANQITNWTGRDVTFAGEPEISLFPYLTVRLRKVALANPPDMKTQTPFLRTEVLTGKLQILPLLAGRFEIAEFRLSNPRINLLIDRDGRANWLLDQGAVGTQAAKRNAEVISDDIAPPSPLADITLGRLLLRNGLITFDDLRAGRHEALSDVTMSLDWPSTAEAATGTGSFTLRGGTVEFNGSIGAPLRLLAGGSSSLRLALASTLLRASFAGNALRLDGTQIDGEATISTPSVQRLVEWMGTPMDTGSVFGAGSITGKMNWIGSSVSFANATMVLDGNTAEGAIAVSFGGGRVGAQGTLALEKLDLTPYLETFQAALVGGGFWPITPIRLPLAGVGDIDLRLSTDQVVMGRTSMGRAAVAATAKDGKLTINVGDAQLYGGHAEATLTAEMLDGALSGTARVKVDHIPARIALSDILGLTALDATGSATIDLTASGRSWGEFAGSVSGGATVLLADGILDSVDVAKVPAVLAAGAKDADLSGSTSFATATGTLKVADGTVSSEDFHAEGETFAIDAAGKARLFNPTLEARGVLSLPATDGSAAAPPNEFPFMVTGSWTAPVFLPDLGRPLQRGDKQPADADMPPESPRG